MLFSGGSIFLFEAGLRGLMEPGGQGFVGRHIGQEIGPFGGVRIDLFDPEEAPFGIMPLLRAGLGVFAVRDRISVRPQLADLHEDRLSLGPYFALGAEKELWFGTSVGIYATSDALVAPVLGSIGVALVLSTQTP
jgi:hypothetical protein